MAFVIINWKFRVTFPANLAPTPKLHFSKLLPTGHTYFVGVKFDKLNQAWVLKWARSKAGNYFLSVNYKVPDKREYMIRLIGKGVTLKLLEEAKQTEEPEEVEKPEEPDEFEDPEESWSDF